MSSSWSGHQTIDPQELESRFANEDSMKYIDSIFEEPTEEAVERVNQIREIMELLPPREADFIDLYFFKRCKQTDIATIFAVSQPTVCYRLQRATARIQFLLNLPSVEEDQMVQDLSQVLSDDLDVKIMVLMHKTTCQSEVAKELDVSQGLVRHRFIRSIEKLRKHKGMEVYVTIFDSISSNLNILREVQRPSWGKRVMHTLLG
jgi:DNA-directed RNA polymerase specialized sigma24 family protein